MEHYKRYLLNDSSVFKFAVKKLDPGKYLSSGQFSVKKHGRSKTSILKSNWCDYSDEYIVVKARN